MGSVLDLTFALGLFGIAAPHASMGVSTAFPLLSVGLAYSGLRSHLHQLLDAGCDTTQLPVTT